MVCRRKCSGWTTFPTGWSVVSSTWFIGSSEVRREGDIPVIGLGEHELATGELHTAVVHRFVSADAQRMAGILRQRFVVAPHAMGDDLRLRRKPMITTPPFQRERGARVAEQVGVEGLQ